MLLLTNPITHRTVPCVLSPCVLSAVFQHDGIHEEISADDPRLNRDESHRIFLEKRKNNLASGACTGGRNRRIAEPGAAGFIHQELNRPID